MMYLKVYSQLQDIAKNSDCQKLKVGCIILDRNYNILSTGYNIALDNNKLCNNNCRNTKDYCYANHAEHNAFLKLKDNNKPYIIYITHSPCLECCKLIIKHRVKQVYFFDVYTKNLDKHYNNMQLLKDNNILFQQL